MKKAWGKGESLYDAPSLTECLILVFKSNRQFGLVQDHQSRESVGEGARQFDPDQDPNTLNGSNPGPSNASPTSLNGRGSAFYA
jgi:hypothetical protein